MATTPRPAWIESSAYGEDAYRCRRCGSVLEYRHGELAREYVARRAAWMRTHRHEGERPA